MQDLNWSPLETKTWTYQWHFVPTLTEPWFPFSSPKPWCKLKDVPSPAPGAVTSFCILLSTDKQKLVKPAPPFQKLCVHTLQKLLLHWYTLFALKVKVMSLSRVPLFATPWTVAHQVPLSMGFSRQEYWSGLPFPSPGDLPDPGIEPRSPAGRHFNLWATREAFVCLG